MISLPCCRAEALITVPFKIIPSFFGDTPVLTSEDLSPQYQAGYGNGYHDGVANTAKANMSSRTPQYQVGYNDGYDKGHLNFEINHQHFSESQGAPPLTPIGPDFISGYDKGYNDAQEDLPPSDATNNAEYDAGYTDGYHSYASPQKIPTS